MEPYRQSGASELGLAWGAAVLHTATGWQTLHILLGRMAAAVQGRTRRREGGGSLLLVLPSLQVRGRLEAVGNLREQATSCQMALSLDAFPVSPSSEARGY